MRGLCISLWMKEWGYRNLEKIHGFRCIWGRQICDSDNKNRHAWWSATRLFFTVGKYAALKKFEAGSKKSIGYAILKHCGWGSCYACSE